MSFFPDGVRVRVAQVKRESPGMRGTTTRSITRMRRNSKSERVLLMRLFYHALATYWVLAELSDDRRPSPLPLSREGERGEKASVHALSPCGRGWRAAPGEGV